MYEQQPKKLMIINIVNILKQYSDAQHRLSQKDIIDILDREYNMKADRKAVKRNLMNLVDFGYSLEYNERVRINKWGEEEIIYTDWYLEHDFSDAELRLLIDSLLFAKHIPCSQCKDLINKIEGLSNRYFSSKVKHICNLPEDQPYNSDLFYSIEILDEAIEKGLQVKFHYANYDIDKKLHSRLTDDGKPLLYTVNPYQLVATNGRYYLICNIDKYDNVAHFRIDRIKDIVLTDICRKPQKNVKELKNGLNLSNHMAEHIYMFSGESEHITMRTKRSMAGEIIDWFGYGVSFAEEDDGTILVNVTANVNAIRFWALQYAPYITVLKPKYLADMIKQNLEDAVKLYSK